MPDPRPPFRPKWSHRSIYATLAMLFVTLLGSPVLAQRIQNCDEGQSNVLTYAFPYAQGLAHVARYPWTWLPSLTRTSEGTTSIGSASGCPFGKRA
jgi:hypothetical protein